MQETILVLPTTKLPLGRHVKVDIELFITTFSLGLISMLPSPL